MLLTETICFSVLQRETKLLLSFFYLIFSPQYRLFIGNPGVGKSTLANCIAKELLFNSGFNIGGGLTFQLDSKIHDGITYLDTPGLADIKLRKEAAKAISKALKKNGTYQIFFIVTLEAGRIRPEDMTTISVVLNSAKDIKHYSIIINKLSTEAYETLVAKENEKLKMLVAEMTELIQHVEIPPAVLPLKLQLELYDQKNKLIKCNELDKFAKEAPCTTVASSSVDDIIQDPLFFEAIMNILLEFIKDLREDKRRLNKLLEETKEKYNRLQVENPQRLKVITFLKFYLSQ